MTDKTESGHHEMPHAGEGRAVALRQRSEATVAARRWFDRDAQARTLDKFAAKRAQEQAEGKARFFLKRDERQMRDLFKKPRRHNG